MCIRDSAYTTATARALENAEVVTVRSVVELRVTVDYSLYEDVYKRQVDGGALLQEIDVLCSVDVQMGSISGQAGVQTSCAACLLYTSRCV